MVSRRTFLKLLFGTGGLYLAAHTYDVTKAVNKLFQPKTYDVLVIGGGPAGVAAALTAARENCRVALVERSPYLGGMGTIGMVSTFVDTWSAFGLFGREIRQNIWGRSFNPLLLDKLLKTKVNEEFTLDLHMETIATGVILEGNTLRGVKVHNKAGSVTLYGEQVIDATGNGDIFALAGAPWTTGRESKTDLGEHILGLDRPDKNVQGCTLCCVIEEKEGTDHLVGRPPDYNPREFEKFIFDQENLTWNVAKDYFWQINWYPLNLGDSKKRFLLNHTHSYGNAALLDAPGLQQLKDTATDRLTRLVYFIQHDLGKDKWGVANLFNTPQGYAPALGIRESRRLDGQYMLSEKDMLEGRKPRDTISLVSHPPDIHVCTRPEENNPAYKGYGYGWPEEERQIFRQNGGYYGIPYRSLLPKKVDNLLVAGRCISGSHIAQSSFRMQPYCYNMGEAAGMAAAMAVKDKIKPAQISIPHLQKKLLAGYTNLYKFDDLRPTHRDYPHAALAAVYGALKVDQDEKVNLDNQVTRAELIAALVRAGGTEISQTLAQTFEDVPPTHLLHKEIEAAAVRGMLPKVASFRPDELANRLDLAQMAINFFHFPVKGLNGSEDTADGGGGDYVSFDDIGDTVDRAVVSTFMETPVLEDYAATVSSRKYRPSEPITRRTLAYAVSGLLAPYVEMPHGREKGPGEVAWIWLFGNHSLEKAEKLRKFLG